MRKRAHRSGSIWKRPARNPSSRGRRNNKLKRRRKLRSKRMILTRGMARRKTDS